jgi:hypothetical protein
MNRTLGSDLGTIFFNAAKVSKFGANNFFKVGIFPFSCSICFIFLNPIQTEVSGCLTIAFFKIEISVGLISSDCRTSLE